MYLKRSEGYTYTYMLLSYCSCSCLPVGGTMAGWGIPVGCMPDGPSISEWENLVQGKKKKKKKAEERGWGDKAEKGGGGWQKRWVHRDALRIGGGRAVSIKAGATVLCKQWAWKHGKSTGLHISVVCVSSCVYSWVNAIQNTGQMWQRSSLKFIFV